MRSTTVSKLLCALLFPVLFSFSASGRVLRVAPSPSASPAGFSGGELPSTSSAANETRDPCLCDSVWYGSTLFTLTLSGDTFVFGDTVLLVYRITNHGSLPETYSFPTSCQEWFGIYPEGCGPLDPECEEVWALHPWCYDMYSYISLQPGESTTFELPWRQHSSAGYRARPAPYVACAAFYSDLFEESLVSVPFTVLPFGPEPIQEALDAAGSGDTVLVAPGVYFENLNMTRAQHGVTLRGDGDPATIFLDAGGRGSALYIHDAACYVDGFTIRGGRESLGRDGNGGGGVTVLELANAYIRGNIIRDNVSTQGGGVSRAALAYAEMTGNVFLNNRATDSGGGVFSDRRTYSQVGDIRGNTFIRNRADSYGGGIFDNGGFSSSMSAHQNIFYRNEAGIAGGGLYCRGHVSAPNHSCNDFWENTPDPLVGCADETNPLYLDPEFCNPQSEDFRLQSSSPCAEENNPLCHRIGAYGIGCASVSVSEALPEGLLRVFPNPSSGPVSFSAGRQRTDGLRLEVFSASGALVWSSRPMEASSSLAWNGLDRVNRPVQAGIYFVRLTGDRGVLGRGTIVRVE